MGYYERPNYEVLEKEGAFELRRFEQFYMVKYKDPSDPYLSEGFQTLFSYISKNNAQQEKISMTVPVIEEKKEDIMTMSFMVPSKLGSEAPAPLDPRLDIERMDEGLFAVVSYRGVTNKNLENEEEEKLLAWAKEKGLSPIGKAFTALYNPPIVPGMLRHNEIWIRVEERLF